MHYYEVAPNQIIRINSASFTYSSEVQLPIGQIVSIEIGKRQSIGIVISEVKMPNYITKHITSVIENKPIPEQLVKLSLWLSEYYVTPLATVLQTVLPTGIHKKRRTQSNIQTTFMRERTNNLLNNEQSQALKIINEQKKGTFLLQGVTGSGKTEVYINLIKQTIKDNKSAIVIVPEIALTSQLISELSNHFSDIIVTHSKMTESTRHIAWLNVLNSTKPCIVVGPRSALFMPLPNIGAIIIDESHEPSLKQEQSPRYSALRAATILGRLHDAKVIFGSATPSVVDRYLAEKSNRPILRLTKVARSNSKPPIIELVDMTKRDNFRHHRFLSNQLIDQITKTLDNKKQILIFHNRRGSTNITLCKNCSWTSECPRCYLPLTLHADKHNIKCHTCGFEVNVPTSCPECGSTDIIHKGIGTKLIETELKKKFPKANIARFDADNQNDETVNARYDDLYNGKIDIAIGTQIIAKGLDLPHLRTVGIIQADNGLSLPDFSSNERTFQLLAQVVGRVGRNEHQTQVIVQSYQPNHPNIINGVAQNYEAFYEHTLHERCHGTFPPFTHILKLTCIYKTEASAIKNSKDFAKKLNTMVNKDVQILGPVPAFYERQNNTYRWQLLLKSPKRKHLIDIVKLIPTKHWQFELDPTSLL